MAEEGVPELVADTVATRVKDLRKARKWTQQDLANAMSVRGYPTDRSTIVRLEKRNRGVSVDDLVALAAALNVSPGWLLLPAEAGELDLPIVGNVKVPAWAAWQWVDGLNPLPTTSEDDGYNTPAEQLAFEEGRPPDLRTREQHPATRAARNLAFRLNRVLHHAERPGRKGDRDLGLETTLRAARQAVDRVKDELDEIEQQASEPRGGRR